jgi:PAS domain S-box-containing protein
MFAPAPPPPESVPAPPRAAGVIFAAALMCALVWLAAAALIRDDRQQSLAAEVTRNDNLALAHEQGVTRSLLWLEQLLMVVRRDYQTLGSRLDLDALVQALQVDLTHINNLVVIDAQGDVVSALHSGVANVAERAYFKLHRDESGDDYLLGPVVKGKISGRWSLTLTRRMVDAQGRFAGVVLLAVEPQLFAGLILQSTLGPKRSVGLMGLDGDVRTQREGDVVSFGGKVQVTGLFEALRGAAAGHFQGSWAAGGPRQLISYRTVQAAPLVVVLATTVDDALAPARARAVVIVVSATLASLLFALLAWGVLRARTRQHQALQQIALKEARYRWLFEHMLDGVLGLDLNGQVRAANPAACALLGRSQDDLLGASLWRLGVEEAPSETDWLARLLRTGHVREERRFARADGSVFDAEVSAALPLAPAGQPDPLVTVVLRDISSRRQTEEAQHRQALAEQASLAKNAFMSRMSHELRTPLNAILGFAQLLERDTQAPLAPRQREQIAHVLRAGRHLLALINEVLDLSQVEGDQVRLRLEAVDLSQLSREVLATLADEATRAGIRLHDLPLPTGPSSAHPPVVADPVRLRQVLFNLVSNAIKYGRSGGWVRLELRAFAQTCRLEVCDNGLGMSEAQLGELFQPFNRLGREFSSLPGTGIGLVISRRLVDLMHGSLTVRSETDLGSVFGVELPRAAQAGSAVAVQESVAHGSGTMISTGGLGAPRGRVLLVEDDLANQAVVQGCLGFRPGIALDIAGTAAQAQVLAAAHWPDVALIDMMLPDGSGLQVLQALRAQAGPQGLRCVAVSANAMPDQVREALAAGFDAYLTKPIQFEQLLAEVDRGLA